jgi:concentrative nucleoside transporter, CNT family
VLPTIIFFASLMAVLYHLGVMQVIVRGMAWVITKVMRVSGAKRCRCAQRVHRPDRGAAGGPKPYILGMTRSELLTLMTGGMATIAGGVLAAYVMLLGGSDPEVQRFYAKHLIAASIMAAPATLVIAKLLCPETGESLTRGHVKVEVEKTTANVIEAAASGAGEGLRLALNVGAMLLAFIALDRAAQLARWAGSARSPAWNAMLGQPLSLSLILGYIVAPIAWLIGVPPPTSSPSAA